jgi:putative endonuclease
MPFLHRKKSLNTTQKGKQGEDIAMKYLVEQGYSIIGKNYRAGHKEIDIIAEQSDTIIFVEVKWRISDAVLIPSDAVNGSKQRHLISAANHYVATNNIKKNIRFDIIGIVSDRKIEHIEDAFSPFGG